MQKHRRYSARLVSLAAAAAMVCAMLPATAFALGGSRQIDSGSVCEIDGTGYTTLADAVTAAESGDTIKILADIQLTDSQGITITSKSITLDLAGKTVGGTPKKLIDLQEGASIEVMDSAGSGGKLEQQGEYQYTIHNSSTGDVTVSTGEVFATADFSSAIHNDSTGTVTVTGGKVSAVGQTGTAIYNYAAGAITVSGGVVTIGEGADCAINNADTGTVTVSGGEVSADNAPAIYCRKAGTITIMQDAGKSTVITSANSGSNSGTICINAAPNPAATILDVQGGTVENSADPEGYSVYFNDSTITSENLSQYYTNAAGATVGKVFPRSVKNVAFKSLTADGVANTEDTIALTLTFDQNIDDLTAEDITLTGAAKGTLLKGSKTGEYRLNISDITVAESETVNVAVEKDDFIFMPSNLDVVVHKKSTPTPPTTSSGGGSSSSSWAPKANNIDVTESAKEMSAAIQAAGTSATYNNFDALLLEGINQINSDVAKYNKGANFKVNFDVVEGGKVLSRIKVNPVELGKAMTDDLPLGVHFDQNNVNVLTVKERFAKYYANETIVITYDQQKPLAVNAEFAAKLDLSKLGSNPYVYSYDPTTNKFTRVQNANIFVDANGYTHITAPLGGSIVITGKPMAEK